MFLKRKKEEAPTGPPPGPPPPLVVEVFPDIIEDQRISKTGVTMIVYAHGWAWVIFRARRIVDSGSCKTREEAQDAGFRRAMELKGEDDVERTRTNHEG